jgi:hypothetical protein
MASQSKWSVHRRRDQAGMSTAQKVAAIAFLAWVAIVLYVLLANAGAHRKPTPRPPDDIDREWEEADQ